MVTARAFMISQSVIAVKLLADARDNTRMVAIFNKYFRDVFLQQA
jgi:hypothetical protein